MVGISDKFLQAGASAPEAFLYRQKCDCTVSTSQQTLRFGNTLQRNFRTWWSEWASCQIGHNGLEGSCWRSQSTHLVSNIRLGITKGNMAKGLSSNNRIYQVLSLLAILQAGVYPCPSVLCLLSPPRAFLCVRTAVDFCGVDSYVRTILKLNFLGLRKCQEAAYRTTLSLSRSLTCPVYALIIERLPLRIFRPESITTARVLVELYLRFGIYP